MKALVLCAGFGTRMGAVCADRPKPLLQVGGEPIVAHILHRLAGHGFHDVFVNLHHRAEQFEPQLQRGDRFGVQLRYLHEAAPLGTAGTSRQLLTAVDEDLLVHYGDILTDHDLSGLWTQHRRTGAAATLLLHQRPLSNSFVKLAADGRVTQFLERPACPPGADGETSWVFSGICVLSPACLSSFPDTPMPDLPRDVFPALVERGTLFGQPLSGYRCAIDSQARLAQACSAWDNGEIQRRGMETGVRAMQRGSRKGVGA